MGDVGLKSRPEIKMLAKGAMREQRGTAILLVFVYGLMVGVSVLLDQITLRVAGWLPYLIVFWAGLLILWVMMVNLAGEYVKIYRREPACVGALFTGLGVNFARKLGGTLWMMLWVFLWSCLLVIPGIIKGLAYSMTYFILADAPKAPARQALKLSMRMTAGYKGELFVLWLSFIGWGILSSFTLGILYIVFVGPYMYATFAGYYIGLRDKAIAEGRISPEELGMAAVGGPSLGEKIPEGRFGRRLGREVLTRGFKRHIILSFKGE